MNKIDRREFLKQSSLAGVVATTGLPLSHAPAADGAGEPLAAASAPLALAGRQLDSKEFCLSVYDGITPALGFTATDRASALEWQGRARARLAELVGGFPARRVALAPEVLERKDLGSYTRERVVFQTRENLSAIGYLLLPKQRARPLAALVCLPGHGRGADDDVGLEPDGTQRAARSTGYAKDFPLQAVEHGYAAFVLEQLAFGARRDEAARQGGPGKSSCQPAACAALLFGQTMVGWRVWDAMRTIDYLAARPEIDAGRIGTMGISGGGTASLFTAALDERVKAAVVSGYFNTFRDCIVSISHCPDNYVPGLLQAMEMYDLAGLVAPRPLFVESGVNDRIFPIQGSRAAYAHAERIYATFGVPERLGREIHDGGHEFSGRGAFEFLARTL